MLVQAFHTMRDHRDPLQCLHPLHIPSLLLLLLFFRRRLWRLVMGRSPQDGFADNGGRGASSKALAK